MPPGMQASTLRRSNCWRKGDSELTSLTMRHPLSLKAMIQRLFTVAVLTLASALPAAGQSMPAVPPTPVESAEAGQQVYKSHAIAMHGEPKYPAGFDHFDYLNADAPKGGTLRLAAFGAFDSFHPFIARGTPAGAAGDLYETLLTPSADEPFTEYGLIAESIEWPEDRSWVTFTLRPEARWHDGKPITVEDVIFSLDTMKEKGHPFFRFYYQSIVKAERVGERSVKFNFAEGNNRELPLIAGQLPILPKHYWESRDFEKTTLEPPLGSGPYRIAEFEPGRFTVQERVKDYWGADLPVNKGRYNFDRIRTDYFFDETVIRQAVKAGSVDLRVENQAKAWALDYDTPAVSRGDLKKIEFEHQRPSGMQAFVMNTRREVFRNRKFREALAYAFDFEWSNRNLFFGQYARTQSFFENSELASRDLPDGHELEILNEFRGRLPEEMFREVYAAPSTDGSGWPRDNLRRAFEILEDAGYEVRDFRLVERESGRPVAFEILIVSPAFERIVLPFIRNLKRLGIDARVRLVDQSQYINRVRAFDFDMIVNTWGQSNSPGNEQRDFWSSTAAEQPGSRNYAGIKDPVVDELIDLVISAPTREALVARTRALDRVLLAGHYVIPQWHSPVDRFAFWDKFGYPPQPPTNGTSPDYWWWDEDKSRRLEGTQTPAQTSRLE